MGLQGILFYFIAAFILFYFILHVRPALIELFSPDATAEALRANIGSKSAILL